MGRDGLATRTVAVAIALVLGVIMGSILGYLVVPRPPSTPGSSTIIIPGMSVQLAVAGGPMPDMYRFVIGGIVNATAEVQLDANVTVYFVNIDTELDHSMVITSQPPPYAATPNVQPAFPGSETRDPTVGIPPGANVSFSFTASAPGTYWYLCEVPGHAASGMYGRIVVG